MGIFTGTLSGIQIFTAMGNGINNMYDITVISIIVSCIGTLVKNNGGIEWLLNFIKAGVHGKRGAKLGIAVLVACVDAATAINSIAIIMSATLAKEICNEYDNEQCIHNFSRNGCGMLSGIFYYFDNNQRSVFEAI